MFSEYEQSYNHNLDATTDQIPDIDEGFDWADITSDYGTEDDDNPEIIDTIPAGTVPGRGHRAGKAIAAGFMAVTLATSGCSGESDGDSNPVEWHPGITSQPPIKPDAIPSQDLVRIGADFEDAARAIGETVACILEDPDVGGTAEGSDVFNNNERVAGNDGSMGTDDDKKDLVSAEITQEDGNGSLRFLAMVGEGDDRLIARSRITPGSDDPIVGVGAITPDAAADTATAIHSDPRFGHAVEGNTSLMIMKEDGTLVVPGNETNGNVNQPATAQDVTAWTDTAYAALAGLAERAQAEQCTPPEAIKRGLAGPPKQEAI